jgi:hypothetical protein
MLAYSLVYMWVTEMKISWGQQKATSKTHSTYVLRQFKQDVLVISERCKSMFPFLRDGWFPHSTEEILIPASAG